MRPGELCPEGGGAACAYLFILLFLVVKVLVGKSMVDHLLSTVIGAAGSENDACDSVKSVLQRFEGLGLARHTAETIVYDWPPQIKSSAQVKQDICVIFHPASMPILQVIVILFISIPDHFNLARVSDCRNGALGDILFCGILQTDNLALLL